tara:strand:- start:1450 stop:1653 length:204 start_codon:yes stop_codon:yes gene_type:complete
MDISIKTSMESISEIDAVWDEILHRNHNITINQIKDGIEYGWYSVDHKGKPRIIINEWNKHLWRNNE